MNNWGIALSDQAKTKSGAEADALFAQAGEKYAEALRIKPDKHGALNNWGLALSDQAKTRSGAEAEALFERAGEKYAEALRIKPGYRSALFNMACLFALRGDIDNSLRWLQKWAEGNPEAMKSKVETNSDFNDIRENEQFQEFVAGLS